MQLTFPLRASVDDRLSGSAAKEVEESLRARILEVGLDETFSVNIDAECE